MTTETDNLNAKIDDLSTAVSDALAQVEAEVQTIKSAPADDGDVVNASANRISALSATIRTALAGARAELSGASPAAAPVSAAMAPAVALAGVPETPTSSAGPAATGPAVPSTDGFVTEASPNQGTSSPALTPSPAPLVAGV